LANSEIIIPKIEKNLTPGEHVVFASTSRNAIFTLDGTWWRCSVGHHMVLLLAHTSEVMSAELAAERMRELVAEVEPESMAVLDRLDVRLRTGRPVSQYAGNEGCAGLAGAEPHA